MSDNFLISGWLSKKGALLGQWTRRFYYVENNQSSYTLKYKHKESDSKASGSLNLQIFDVLQSTEDEFLVETPSAIVILKAPSSTERARWVAQQGLIRKHYTRPFNELNNTAICSHCHKVLLDARRMQCSECKALLCSSSPCSTFDKQGNAYCMMCKSTVNARIETEQGSLLITVVGANLEKEVDSYCTLQFANVKGMSAVEYKAKDPVYNLQAVLPVYDVALEHKLEIHVFRHDQLGKHDTLGKVKIPVLHLVPKILYKHKFLISPHQTVEVSMVRVGRGSEDARSLGIARLVGVLTRLRVNKVWRTLVWLTDFREPFVCLLAYSIFCLFVVFVPTEALPTILVGLLCIVIYSEKLKVDFQQAEQLKRKKIHEEQHAIDARKVHWKEHGLGRVDSLSMEEYRHNVPLGITEDSVSSLLPEEAEEEDIQEVQLRNVETSLQQEDNPNNIVSDIDNVPHRKSVHNLVEENPSAHTNQEDIKHIQGYKVREEEQPQPNQQPSIVPAFKWEKHADMIGGALGSEETHTTSPHVIEERQYHPYPSAKEQTRDIIASSLFLEMLTDLQCLQPEVIGENPQELLERQRSLLVSLLHASAVCFLTIFVPFRVLLIGLATYALIHQVYKQQNTQNYRNKQY